MDLIKIKQESKKKIYKELIIFIFSIYPGLIFGEILYTNSKTSEIIQNHTNIQFEFGLKIFKYF